MSANGQQRENKIWRVIRSTSIALAAIIMTAAGIPLESARAQTQPGQAAKPPAQTPPPQAAPAAVPNGVQLVAQMPGTEPSKPYHFPPVATRTLPNGLRVFVVTSSSEPAIGVQLLMTSAGSVNDPQGKPGVASMAASLLTQGTGKRTAQQIAESIDFVGGSLSATAADDDTIVGASVVKKDFDLAMDLLADVVLRASFQDEEIARQKMQLLSNLRVSYDDADYLASAVFERAVYGQHPYGLPTEGTPVSIQAITREDVVQFRDTYYTPGTALLAFSGDISPEAAFAAAEKYFGAWSTKTATAPAHAAPVVAPGVHIIVVNKSDAVQTQIRIGKPGVRRSDAEFIPLYVTDRIFGGSYNSRLNTEVRVKKGLTYGANSVFDTRMEAGNLLASTYTRTETTVPAVQLVVDQIKGMASGNLKPEELTFARDYLVGVYPIQTETPDEVASRVLTAAHYGLPANYNETYQNRISAVTLQQANSEATKYFQPATLEIVLAGNAALFRDNLKREFPDATYEEFTPAEMDLLLSAMHRLPESVPAATPEAIAQGKSEIADAAQAAGGDAIAKIQSVEYSGVGVQASPQGDLPVQLKLSLAYPNHYRVDTTVNIPGLAGNALVVSYDGKTGWTSSPQGTNDIPPAQYGEFIRRILLTGGIGLYQASQAGTIQVQAIGSRDFQGMKTDAVAVVSGSVHAVVYFEAATHLAAGARYQQDTSQGAVETIEVWSDYREVDGAKFPCHVVTLRNGQKFSEFTVQEIKFNVNPDASLFVKPAAKP
nr:pitrilysin family protein [Candidatus Acidoferrales bacterium]